MNFRKGSWVKVEFEAQVEENGNYTGRNIDLIDSTVRRLSVGLIDDPQSDPIGTVRKHKHYGYIVKTIDSTYPWLMVGKSTMDGGLDAFIPEISGSTLGPIVFRPEETND